MEDRRLVPMERSCSMALEVGEVSDDLVWLYWCVDPSTRCSRVLGMSFLKDVSKKTY